MASWEHLQHQFIDYRKGEASVVKPLFGELQVLLKKFFALKGATGADQEDLAQDTLLKIHLNRDSFDATRSLKTWVYVIAHRNLIDQWRQQHDFSTDGQDALMEIVDSSAHFGDVIEIRQHLEKILSDLKPFDRNLVYLYGWEELSTKELSEVTGLSETAVKVKIHRILKGIKEKHL
jgi:RNA polymerase sigma-70 factor (ECF subfamily)